MAHELDWSLAARIAQPSPAFRDFVTQFFSDPQIWIRRESDLTLVDRLTGDERATAREMLMLNLHTGREHIIGAVASLRIAAAIPELEELLAGASDGYQRFVIADALHALGALDDDRLFAIMAAIVRDGDWSQTLDVLKRSYRVLPLRMARELIDTGLHREESGIQSSARDALTAVRYIEQHGGTFTEELGRDIIAAWIDSFTIQSDAPSP